MSETLRNCKIEELFGEVYNHELGYGLSDWFEALRNKRLRDIRDEDISRLIRQKLIEECAVLEASFRLPENPEIGLYDGEVIAEISKLSQDFWRRNEDLRIKFMTIVNKLEDPNGVLKNFEWMGTSFEKEFWSNLRILKSKLQM
jgi:hypothetical protein